MSESPSFEEILHLIPHRDPFLWVDRIISVSEIQIITEKDIPDDLDLFRGHYPGNPIMPGVLLCEAIFQSGALLMAKNARDQSGPRRQLPILTRIGGAKFKRTVGPGDTIRMEVMLVEEIASVAILRGTLRVNGKVAVKVDFSCATTLNVA